MTILQFGSLLLLFLKEDYLRRMATLFTPNVMKLLVESTSVKFAVVTLKAFMHMILCSQHVRISFLDSVMH